MLTIHPIPLLQDNYAWLLTTEGSPEAAVVDPSEAGPVIERLQKENLILKTILITHHHWDHTGGIEGLLEHAPHAEVLTSSYDHKAGRTPGVTHSLNDGDTIEVLGAKGQCYLVPGHTLGAMAFYFEDEEALFTGDTFFTAGCGRLFEGTPAQMMASLERLASLDSETLIYCGHEYTEKNLRFAQSVLPEDKAIDERLGEVLRLRAKNENTVPAPLKVERETNLFLRATCPILQRALGTTGPLETFTKTREARNHF